MYIVDDYLAIPMIDWAAINFTMRELLFSNNNSAILLHHCKKYLSEWVVH